MSMTRPACDAGEPRRHIKVVANVPFNIVNAFVRPVGDTFELAGKITFRPQPRDVVWGTGHLTFSVARYHQAATSTDAFRMDVVVPGPVLRASDPGDDFLDRMSDVYALVDGFTRVRVIPNGEDSGKGLGLLLMSHLNPRVDSADPLDGNWSFPGVAVAGRDIPVRIAAPDFGAMAARVADVNGWDPSVVYHWEAPITPTRATAADDQALAQPTNPASAAAKAKTRTSRDKARRPSANGAKRK